MIAANLGLIHMDLGSALIAVARQHRANPALWSKGTQLTYGELFERAGGIAHALVSLGGIGPGKRVAILSDRTVTAYICIVATLLSGAAYVPLNPRFPIQRNRQILEESGATALLCDERHSKLTCELVRGVTALELVAFPEGGIADGLLLKQLGAETLTSRSLDLPSNCETASGNLAYVFFTSGSTGKPKGVPISHANVFAYLDGIRTICSIDQSDRLLQLVDLTFDLSVHDMFLCWTSGACLYSVPETAVLLSTRFVSEHDVTAWLSVPSTPALIKQAGLLEPASMPTLRHTFFCGEALSGTIAEAWAKAAPNSRIDNIYGPTEATVAFSAFHYVPGQADPPAVVALGKPFPGQHMALYSERGGQVDFGEICLAGSQVMDGYWQDPEMTTKRIFEADGRRWYRTGDLGRYDEGRGFLYAGRADHQVKIRGYRVELQEIEHVVREESSSDLVAVLPWSKKVGEPTMGCIAFALHPGQNEAETLQACRTRLPEYMVPTRIVAVHNMPFNANGKVDYVALRSHPLMAEITKGKKG